jgi:hypothetical protein
MRILIGLAAVAVCGCNQRVFVQVDQNCDSTIPVDFEVPQQKKTDILVVVDNSGSMQDKQDRLVANFSNPACPLTDLSNIPKKFKNPSPDVYAPGGPLADCGFIQLLAAFDDDFHVGVVTTDVGFFDNRVNQAPPGWGVHPERGCLQPDGAPGAAGLHKVMTHDDLKSSDASKSDIATRFANTLANIRTFGSPYERGLDAMQIFLDPSSTRAPGCDSDLDTFRRKDADLVVIFLSDEDDCSHDLMSDPPFDELAGEPKTPGEWDPLYASTGLLDGSGPDRCYAQLAKLAPITAYADALKAHDANAKVIAVGGLVPDATAPSGFVAEGCLAGDPPSSVCFASHGDSNATASGEICADDTAGARGGLPCCLADTGSRYLDFASQFQSREQKSFLVDSICSDRFKDTMITAAAFIASSRFVDLVEAPKDGDVVVTEDSQHVDEISAASCDAKSGWYLDGDRRIVFCNGAIPGPGVKVSIRAKGQLNTAECGG